MRRIVLAVLFVLLIPPPARAAFTLVYERTKIPMRDGVLLSADIWRPAGAVTGVIVTMSPYHVLNKALDRVESDLPDDIGQFRWVQTWGYAYARIDVRGTYNSGGCWDYGGLKERQDGYDVVEWFGGVKHDGTPSPAATWSNGKVAMVGASYDGTTANAAAVEQPPHLATIVPISAISRWWGYAYQQGARATYSGESADIDPPSDTPTDFMFAYGLIPPPDQNGLNSPEQFVPRLTPCDRANQTLHGYDPQPDYDDFWRERDYLVRADLVNVPVLVAHGQLDFNVKTWEGTAWFQALDVPKKLLIGQWPHALPGHPTGWNTYLKRWFDRWLLGTLNGIDSEPAVNVQDNTGAWRTDAAWGEGATAAVALGGGTRALLDDGALTESEMVRGLSPSRYARVPLPATAGMHIQGRPVLHLSASSDAPSTHFVAVLCDVGPTGACSVVSRAFMNARYRSSLETGVDLVPGERATFDLEFIDKDYRLAPDHRFELIIASSSLTWVASNELRATNTLYLDDSTVDLPLA